MSDFARLKEKLGKLRQVEPRAETGRLLSGQDASARLLATLTEIDETILPRRITITDGANAVSVAAANRQLSLILDSEIVQGDAPHAVEGRADPRLETFRDSLLKMFAAPGPWSVTTSKLDRTQIGQMRPDGGVAASTLKTQWGLDSDGAGSDAATQDTARRFAQRIAGRSQAWLLIEGEDISESGGSDQGIEWLSERAGGFLDGYYARRDDFASNGPVALAFSGGSGASILYFESGDVAGFATLSPQEMASAFSEWTASLTR